MKSKSHPIRVLMLNETLTTSKMLSEVGALAKSGIKIDIYATLKKNQKANKLLKPNENLKIMDVDFDRDLINQIDQRVHYHLIHGYLTNSINFGIMLKKILRIPLVVTLESIPGEEKKDIKLFHSPDRIIAVSPQEKINLINQYDIDDQKIAMIPYGVNRHIFYPLDQLSSREKLGIAKEKKLFLYVDRFKKNSGIMTLINAIWHIKKYWNDLSSKLEVHILSNDLEITDRGIIALNRLGNAVIKKIADLELGDYIKLQGPIAENELRYYFAAADGTIMPSEYEITGFVGLQSMACGTPIIASYAGALKWIVENEITGLHFKMGDAQDLAHKLVRIMKSPKLNDRLGKNATVKIKNDFDETAVTNRTLKLYQELIKQ